jgi:hypothetical protein
MKILHAVSLRVPARRRPRLARFPMRRGGRLPLRPSLRPRLRPSCRPTLRPATRPDRRKRRSQRRFSAWRFADISTLHQGRDMKCNLAAPSLLSIIPSSLAPLALGAFAIASALATQRLDPAPPRGGRHGRRSRARTGARADRRGEQERRHPAPSAAVGLPEATAGIIASVGEHRVLSTEQVRTIHLPGHSLRRTQQVLAGIEEAGLIHHVDSGSHRGASGSSASAAPRSPSSWSGWRRSRGCSRPPTRPDR